MNIFNKIVEQANYFKLIMDSDLPYSQIEYVLLHEDTEDNCKELYMMVCNEMPTDSADDGEEFIEAVLVDIEKYLDKWIELSITEEIKE